MDGNTRGANMNPAGVEVTSGVEVTTGLAGDQTRVQACDGRGGRPGR